MPSDRLSNSTEDRDALEREYRNALSESPTSTVLLGAKGHRDRVRVRVTQVYEMDVDQDVKFENGVTTVWPNVTAIIAGIDDSNMRTLTFEVIRAGAGDSQ